MKRAAVIILCATLTTIICGVAVLGFSGGYRFNLTPSEPLGIWRIEQLDRPAAVGDMVFICPPATAPFAKGRERGYLRPGLCPGGFAPLIKAVAALPGQYIEIIGKVVIDGHPSRDARVLDIDGEGRPIEPYSGGIVPSGHLFLLSSFASSYDSRYFGPVPASGLLGLARPVLTFKL